MAMTLGQFRDVTKEGSEFVPMLVNGQPVASAALVRDSVSGDLQCAIVTENVPAQPAASQDVIQESEPAAQELEPPVIDETDKLDLQQAQDDGSSPEGNVLSDSPLDESPGQDDPADEL